MASKTSKPLEEAPEAPIRWTLSLAAREFHIARESLRRKLGDIHQQPGADGCYSTKQITSALYGDLYRARLEVQREQAQKLHLENSITRCSLLDRTALEEGFSALADGMRCCVENSGLSREAQKNFLRELATWPIVIANVVDKQSRVAVEKLEAEKEEAQAEA
jgi:hypothetical protein